MMRVAMDEARVKAEILAFVRHNGGNRHVVVTAEYSLGNSGVRADLALLADRELIGIEIKSEKDSLRRLPNQLSNYATYFDHVVLVVAKRHLRGLEETDLKGASVWVVDNDEIAILQVGQRQDVDQIALLDLLSVNEKRSVIKSQLPVREFVCQIFDKRYGKTSGRFWKSVDQRRIEPDDLKLLSRYSEEREIAKKIALQREEYWKQWRDTYSTGPVLSPF